MPCQQVLQRATGLPQSSPLPSSSGISLKQVVHLQFRTLPRGTAAPLLKSLLQRPGHRLVGTSGATLLRHQLRASSWVSWQYNFRND